MEAQVYFMVGFDVSARILAFWGVMLVAGTCGLSLFMLIAIFSPTITVAAAVQARRRASLPWPACRVRARGRGAGRPVCAQA